MFDTSIQVNLQQGFGGGEVFTATFARALQRLGVETRLFVDPRANAWSSLRIPAARVESLADPADLPGLLRRGRPGWLVFHTAAPDAVVDELRAQGHLVTAFAHMPLYGRDPRPLAPFDLVLAGSTFVCCLTAGQIRRGFRTAARPLALRLGSAQISRPRSESPGAAVAAPDT